MASTTSLEEKPYNAIVTGGASGIGEAVCKKLASRGINIIVADKNVDQGQRVASELSKSYSVDAAFFTLDVTQEEEIKELVEFAANRWGRLDYAANCAGVCIEDAWNEEESVSASVFDKTFAVNQRGVWLCQKYEALYMQKQEPREIHFDPPAKYPIKPQRGAIVNISSLSGLNGMGLPAYTPSKYGVLGITQNGAKFYGPYGIRCNSLCPGLTLTPMLEGTFGLAGTAGTKESQSDASINNISLRRKAYAQEQANVLSFLLSPEASYVNGAHLVVDGGFNNIH